MTSVYAAMKSSDLHVVTSVPGNSPNGSRQHQHESEAATGRPGDEDRLHERTHGRRKFFHQVAVNCGVLSGLSFSALTTRRNALAAEPIDSKGTSPTEFQIACMTLPYSQFPLSRALEGIRSAGFRFVAWGTTHKEEGGKSVPVVPPDAPLSHAKDLGSHCRDMGLEPLMMFSTVYPEANNGLEILRQRILQASAAGVPQVLTFGHTQGGNRGVWIERFRQLGRIARDNNVLLVVKQHGGDTGTGAACAEITREVNDDGIKVNYDAGNVMDYLNVDPLADIAKCADEIRSFCIKDHRNFPKDEDCGPGLGEIDHYRLLSSVAKTGRKMPLCCENIFAPVVRRPQEPEGVDALAKRAREFLELVIAGVQAS